MNDIERAIEILKKLNYQRALHLYLKVSTFSKLLNLPIGKVEEQERLEKVIE